MNAFYFNFNIHALILLASIEVNAPLHYSFTGAIAGTELAPDASHLVNEIILTVHHISGIK